MPVNKSGFTLGQFLNPVVLEKLKGGLNPQTSNQTKKVSGTVTRILESIKDCVMTPYVVLSLVDERLQELINNQNRIFYRKVRLGIVPMPEVPASEIGDPLELIIAKRSRKRPI